MRIRYTWDPAKNRANLLKHGIAFEDAVKIFDGPTVEQTDDRFDYGERRVYAIGFTADTVVTVVYVDQGDMISAWKAEAHERRYFWRHVDE